MMTILVILAVVFAAYISFGLYFFNIAFNPKVSKKYILRDLTRSEDRKNVEGQNPEEDAQWLKDMAEEIQIMSKDKLNLYGYSIKNPMKQSNTWVILAHGYMGKASEMVSFAKEFIDRGYHVLIPDLRAHGKSQGKYIGMGWPDRLDMVTWIQKICCSYSDCNIVLYGVSMGAATMMMTTGERLPANVKVCIEDCGYTSVYDEFRWLLKGIHPIMAKLILSSSNLISKILLGYGFKEASSMEQIKTSTIPTLFIHGSEDKFVPFEMHDTLYNAATCPKQKLVVEGAHHVESRKMAPELYWNTIEESIRKQISIDT